MLKWLFGFSQSKLRGNFLGEWQLCEFPGGKVDSTDDTEAARSWVLKNVGAERRAINRKTGEHYVYSSFQNDGNGGPMYFGPSPIRVEYMNKADARPATR